MYRTHKNGLNKNFLAFSGIGNNESFFNTLEKNNYNLVKKLSFPDHYQYTKQDIERIINTSKQKNLIPITTEKTSTEYHHLYIFYCFQCSVKHRNFFQTQ